MRTLILCSLTAWLVAGCGREVSFEDQGRLCAFAAEPTVFNQQTPQQFVADAAIELLVVMEECASGCARDISTGCEVQVSGDTIAVTSRASYVDDSGGRIGCADVCLPVFATCPTPPLPAGSYQLTHGGQSLTLEIPSSTETAPCVTTEP